MRQNILRDLLSPASLEAAKRAANRAPIAELVQQLMEISPRQRVLAFRLLEKDKAMAVFEYLRPEEQADLIRSMENPEVIRLVEALPPDERVRLFEELPAKVTKRLIANLSPEAREAVNILLNYPERSAGRLMNLRYLAVRDTLTVGAALASVRDSQLGDDELDVIFVVDDQRFYKGLVRTVRLVKVDPDLPIRELIEGSDIVARVTDRDLQAARLLKDSGLPAIPVVDSEGRLVGDITFEDVINLVEEEATDAALAQAGVGNLLSRDKVWSERLVKGSRWYAVRLRIAFLIVTLIGGMLVGGLFFRLHGSSAAKRQNVPSSTKSRRLGHEARGDFAVQAGADPTSMVISNPIKTLLQCSAPLTQRTVSLLFEITTVVYPNNSQLVTNANSRNKPPTTQCTARSEMWAAKKRPPTTANPTISPWPRVAPAQTLNPGWVAAKETVAIWVLSPNSAKAVRLKASHTTAQAPPRPAPFASACSTSLRASSSSSFSCWGVIW